MPLYEYECSQCGLVFEARQKFSDPVLEVCRECGAAVKKMISHGGFALKGGGWYEQGYSSAKSAPACSAPSAGSCSGCPKASGG
ncbi:MAG: zinc ribbon domain-containing protein [Thermodesulfobacteriota bacterium]|nr:zinc ribbon domain-containing protein [Thermodesulfobacteriota bacterium]